MGQPCPPTAAALLGENAFGAVHVCMYVCMCMHALDTDTARNEISTNKKFQRYQL